MTTRITPLGDQGDVDVVAFPFVEEDRELLFPDEFSETVRGCDVAGGERRERGRIETPRMSPCTAICWPFLVDQKDDLRVGVDLRR